MAKNNKMVKDIHLMHAQQWGWIKKNDFSIVIDSHFYETIVIL